MKHRVQKHWIWGITALAVAGAVFMLWQDDEDAQKQDETKIKRPRLIEEVQSAKIDKKEAREDTRPKPPGKPADWAFMSKRERIEWLRENRPIDTNTIVSTAPVISSFRRKKTGRRPNFENYVQSELAHYVVPGRDLPPPDRITDEQAREALETEIVYLEDDSEATIEEKQAVEDMLGELKAFMDAGGHADEYFQKLYARQQLEGEAVQTVRQEVRALLEEGKIDEARETLVAFNEYLAEKGIPPVDIKLSRKYIENTEE